MFCRLKETIEKLSREAEEARLREQSSQVLYILGRVFSYHTFQESQKRMSRQLRELREDYTTVQVSNQINRKPRITDICVKQS